MDLSINHTQITKAVGAVTGNQARTCLQLTTALQLTWCPPSQARTAARASKHSSSSSKTCQIRHQHLTNHPTMRQTCESKSGTTQQCSARNLPTCGPLLTVHSARLGDAHALVPERKAQTSHSPCQMGEATWMSRRTIAVNLHRRRFRAGVGWEATRTCWTP